MFKISHSKAKTGRRCLKAYQYRYIHKLRKRVKSRALIVGTLVHSCLENYFRSGSYTGVIREWKEKEFNKMFKEEQALHSDIIPLVKTLIRGYISNWHELGMEMLWVEKDFEVEIAPGIWLIGKIDGRSVDSKKRQWLVEHKTCKKMPGEEVRLYDTQVLTYSSVLPMLGEKPVTGVMWDYVRTKLPAKPELLKSGALSTRKNIDTTPEVYLREIRRHGLDPIGYEEILKDLRAKRDAFYRQVFLPMKPAMAQGVVMDLVMTAQLLQELEKRYYEDGLDCFARNISRDCSWCDYATLCHAELRGDDTTYIMKHDYIVRSKDAGKEKEDFISVE